TVIESRAFPHYRASFLFFRVHWPLSHCNWHSNSSSFPNENNARNFGNRHDFYRPGYRLPRAFLASDHHCSEPGQVAGIRIRGDRKSTRLNSSHVKISYAVFCLKKKKK